MIEKKFKFYFAFTNGPELTDRFLLKEGTLGILDTLRDPLGTLRHSQASLGNPGGWFLKGVSWDGSVTVF